MSKTVTIIVPAHNEEAGLPATLGALVRQTVPVLEPGYIERVVPAFDDPLAVVAAGNAQAWSQRAAGRGGTAPRAARNFPGAGDLRERAPEHIGAMTARAPPEK